MRVTCLSVNYNNYQGYAAPNINNPAATPSPGVPVSLVNATVNFGPAVAGEPGGLSAQNFSLTFERIEDTIDFFPGKVYDLALTPVED